MPSPATVLEFQSTIGNQQVARMIHGGPSGTSITVIQRALTEATIREWKKKRRVEVEAARKKRETYDRVSSLLAMSMNKGASAPQEELRELLPELIADPNEAEYHPVLKKILAELSDSDRPAEEPKIAAFVKAHEDELFPETSADCLDPDLKALRRRILIRKVNGRYGNQVRIGDLTVLVLKGYATRGVDPSGQWTGKLLCQESAQALTDNAIGIERTGGENHYIQKLSSTEWKDPTWKQFFMTCLGQTAGLPPIFEGTGRDFRRLGLPQQETDNYLSFIARRIEGAASPLRDSSPNPFFGTGTGWPEE